MMPCAASISACARLPVMSAATGACRKHAGGVALHQLAHGFGEQGGPRFGFLVELVGRHGLRAVLYVEVVIAVGLMYVASGTADWLGRVRGGHRRRAAGHAAVAGAGLQLQAPAGALPLWLQMATGVVLGALAGVYALRHAGLAGFERSAALAGQRLHRRAAGGLSGWRGWCGACAGARRRPYIGAAGRVAIAHPAALFVQHAQQRHRAGAGRAGQGRSGAGRFVRPVPPRADRLG
jgi:hypothetical protein